MKSKTTAILLCLALGWLGAHRFYLGYTLTGVIQLLTFGGFGFWVLVDFVRLVTGFFSPKDSEWGKYDVVETQTKHSASSISSEETALQEKEAENKEVKHEISNSIKEVKMSYQDELFENFQKAYPECEVKKINKDSNIDIYVPGLHERRNIHINFDVKKDGVNVKLHFVLPDLAEYRFFLEKLSDEVSAYGKEGSGSQGIFHNNKLIAYNKYDEITSSASLMIDLFKNNLTSYSSGSKATEATEVIETEIKDWTISEKICFLFYGLGFIADSNLDDSEEKIIIKLIGDFSEITQEELIEIRSKCLNKISELGNQQDAYNAFLECAQYLVDDGLPDSLAKVMIQNLTKIALADRQLAENEVNMIKATSKIFGYECNLEMDDGQLGVHLNKIGNGIEKKKEEKGDAIISDIPDFPVYTKLTAEQVNIICERIQSQLTLPHLGFVFDDLREHYGDYLDRHVPFYYHDNLVVGEEMEGFVFVNMDGFYGNIQDKDEIITFFSWDSVGDMKIKVDEDDNTAALGLFPKEGEGFLSIEEKDGTSLKIVHQLYWSVYKQIIERFEDEPAILWDIVRDDLNIDMQSFNNWDEFVDFKK